MVILNVFLISGSSGFFKKETVSESFKKNNLFVSFLLL